MSILENAGDAVKKWLLRVALKKALVSFAKLIVAFFVSKGLVFTGVLFGVPVDMSNVDSVVALLTLGVNSLLTVVRNWLKVKWPKLFGWM